jgi:uncharacterized peroxidase-related enzyme
MRERKMTWIKTIDEADARGQLKEIYEKIKTQRGKVANIVKAHSLSPEAMKAHIDLYIPLMFGNSGLTRPEREMMAVVVSSANRCEYCVNHHAEALNYYWKDDNRLQRFAQDLESVELPERQRRMLEFAVKLTLTPAEVEESDIEALRESGFSDENILSIDLIVSYFNFVNRIALGLGVEFTPEEVRGYNF